MSATVSGHWGTASVKEAAREHALTIQGAGYVYVRTRVAGAGRLLLSVMIDAEMLFRLQDAERLTIDGSPIDTSPVGLGLGALHSAGRREGSAALVTTPTLGTVAINKAAALGALDVRGAGLVEVETAASTGDEALVVTVDGFVLLTVRDATAVLVNGQPAHSRSASAAAYDTSLDLSAVRQQLDQVAQAVEQLALWIDRLGPIRQQLGDAATEVVNLFATMSDLSTEELQRRRAEVVRLLEALAFACRPRSPGIAWAPPPGVSFGPQALEP